MLEKWLEEQTQQVAVAIAARAALRVAPLVGLIVFGRERRSEPPNFLFELMSAVLQCGAFTRAVGKYPTGANRFRIVHRSAESAYAVASASSEADAAAAYSASAADFAADAAVGSADAAARAAALTADRASLAAAAAARGAGTAVWAEIRTDVAASQRASPDALLDLPLWSRGAPLWASDAWELLRIAIRRTDDSDVWNQWYEDRLHGGSRGEAHEIVFAMVPEETRKMGQWAVNVWIKGQLPEESETAPELPPPLSNLESPFAYNWTAALKVAAVPGPQNLPFYSFFDSEEHHRRALEACRKGADRLLKALREGDRYNVRREYAEALRYYLKDLPKAAREGNILLANDQAVNLREMFVQDLEILPAGFASPLRRVIENQFALNAFYDLVKKHQDAIAASKLTLPFPAEAARRFFGRDATLLRAPGRRRPARRRARRAAGNALARRDPPLDRDPAAAAAAGSARSETIARASDRDRRQCAVGDLPQRQGSTRGDRSLDRSRAKAGPRRRPAARFPQRARVVRRFSR
jgi:hypothetical protein